MSTCERFNWDALSSHLRKVYGSVSFVSENVIHVSHKLGGEIFYFQEGLASPLLHYRLTNTLGSVVFWSVAPEDRAAVLEDLKPFEDQPHTQKEEDEMTYVFHDNSSVLSDDTIRIDGRQPVRTIHVAPLRL